MDSVAAQIDALAHEQNFSGVVAVDRDNGPSLARAYGFAHRALQIPNTVETRFATASATKGMTALAVVSLIEAGVLAMATTARSVLGKDLPLIDDRVTVEQLLAHRSGIGDYFDEDELDITDYVLPVPVHQLANAEDYLKVLDGFPTTFPPGEQFRYNNGGYVVLAVIAERASGVPYHDLVAERVFAPAGMVDSGFFRYDSLPARTATGYLDDSPDARSNVLHLPVRGVGDGGMFTTVADISRFWRALFGGKIIGSSWVNEMVRPRSDVPDSPLRCGLGLFLHPHQDAVVLLGQDAGISFRSLHIPSAGQTHTVMSNTDEGVWPISKRLDQLMSIG